MDIFCSNTRRRLLATDQARSVQQVVDDEGTLAYMPFGYAHDLRLLPMRVAFNGEPPDLLNGHYPLGLGYRRYSFILMRFTSPDSWSPFASGGLNSYVYCGADPINHIDPDGHMPFNKPVRVKKSILRGVPRQPNSTKPNTLVSRKVREQRYARVDNLKIATASHSELENNGAFDQIRNISLTKFGRANPKLLRTAHVDMLDAVGRTYGTSLQPAARPIAIKNSQGELQLFGGHMTATEHFLRRRWESASRGAESQLKSQLELAILRRKNYDLKYYKADLTKLPYIDERDFNNGIWNIRNPAAINNQR